MSTKDKAFALWALVAAGGGRCAEHRRVTSELCEGLGLENIDGKPIDEAVRVVWERLQTACGEG